MDQCKDPEPQECQVVPIPTGDLYGDSLCLKLEGKKTPASGNKQGQQPSGKMDGMCAGQQVKVSTARVGGKINALMAQTVPNNNLSCQKAETQQQRDSKPGQIAPEPRRNNPHGGELFFLLHGATGKFQRAAAQQQNKRVGPQLQVRELERNPVCHPAVRVFVVSAFAKAENIHKSQRHEDGSD